MDIPSPLLAKLRSQLLADPGLPRVGPTQARWQIPPHPTMSTVRSENLQTRADYVIVGSGVTGCSIAHHLLHATSSKNGSVVVFEARTLTSGATGRNGGALATSVPIHFAQLKETLGIDEAVKIAMFADRTLDKMHELGNSTSELKEASEVRRLRGVIGFETEEAYELVKQSIEQYCTAIPAARNSIEIISTSEAAERFQVKNVVGAIVAPTGACWPYRLFTTIWEQLLVAYRDRLAVETNTPVTAIVYDPEGDSTYPYVVETTRGSTRARHVLHATNGYSGHLNPGLRGKIYPLRGTMSAQQAGLGFGQHGNERSWTFIHAGKLEAARDISEEVIEGGIILETGLYYANQNPKTHDVFIGGEKVHLDDIFVSDDTHINDCSKENICSIMKKYYSVDWEDADYPRASHVWSGIMGFTADRFPLIGKLGFESTKRGSNAKFNDASDTSAEWICAGFNGYGMSTCWSSGEAVVRMILGQSADDFLPASFIASEERLRSHTFTAEPTIAELFSF